MWEVEDIGNSDIVPTQFLSKPMSCGELPTTLAAVYCAAMTNSA